MRHRGRAIIHPTKVMSSRPPIGGCRSRIGKTLGLAEKRARKPGDELDKIGLASGAGFFEQAT
jgi:hypothetical protein